MPYLPRPNPGVCILEGFVMTVQELKSFTDSITIQLIQ